MALQEIRAARADYKQVMIVRQAALQQQAPKACVLPFACFRSMKPAEALQVLALEPTNRQAIEELHALRAVPDELDQTSGMQDGWKL